MKNQNLLFNKKKVTKKITYAVKVKKKKTSLNIYQVSNIKSEL